MAWNRVNLDPRDPAEASGAAAEAASIGLGRQRTAGATRSVTLTAVRVPLTRLAGPAAIQTVVHADEPMRCSENQNRWWRAEARFLSNPRPSVCDLQP